MMRSRHWALPALVMVLYTGNLLSTHSVANIRYIFNPTMPGKYTQLGGSIRDILRGRQQAHHDRSSFCEKKKTESFRSRSLAPKPTNWDNSRLIEHSRDAEKPRRQRTYRKTSRTQRESVRRIAWSTCLDKFSTSVLSDSSVQIKSLPLPLHNPGHHSPPRHNFRAGPSRRSDTRTTASVLARIEEERAENMTVVFPGPFPFPGQPVSLLSVHASRYWPWTQ